MLNMEVHFRMKIHLSASRNKTVPIEDVAIVAVSTSY